LFQISEVFAQKSPVLFTLIDLLGEKVPGYFYAKELTKSKDLNYETDYFFVEKILKRKTVKKEKYCLVKYLFYSNKFNEWVKEKDIKFGEK